MKDWKEYYDQKVTSKEESLLNIVSGNRVVFGHAAGEPIVLVDELVNQKDRLQNVEIVHMVPLRECKYSLPGMETHFHHNSLFAGAGTRKSIHEGRSDYTPVFFSEIPRLFRENILPVDVTLVQLSPPDKKGNMSFGISIDYTKQAVESAKIVIAEVNKQMPWTNGSYIHISQIDWIKLRYQLLNLTKSQ